MRRWTRKEVDFVRNNKKNMTIQEMATKLNRTYHSVRHRSAEFSDRWCKPIELNLSDYQKGFLVGLLEGEGTLTILRDKEGRAYPRIAIYNTERKLLERIRYILKFGKISSTPSKGTNLRIRRGNLKIQHQFYISSIAKVLSLLKELQPHFITKRNKVDMIYNSAILVFKIDINPLRKRNFL